MEPVGYRRTLGQNWSLVPDDPNIEKAPDHSANDRNYDNYAVYWPARLADGTLRQPQRSTWRQEGVHRTRIQTAAREAVAESLFSGGRRDLESLKLGCVTIDRLSYPAPTAVYQQAADSCIRMLGKRRRIDTHRATGDDNQLPKYARDYLEEVANANSITPADFVQDVTSLLTRAGVFSQGILLFRGLFVADPTEVYFQCSRCSRVHLHRSGGICSGCLTPLGSPLVTGVDDAGQEIDYYRWLAVDAGPIFRLNCAEMTGQTDKVLARDRQRLFQNIPVGDEVALTDNIDLLRLST